MQADKDQSRVISYAMNFQLQGHRGHLSKKYFQKSCWKYGPYSDEGFKQRVTHLALTTQFLFTYRAVDAEFSPIPTTFRPVDCSIKGAQMMIIRIQRLH